MEWVRFCFTALFLVASLAMGAISLAGVFKFRYILNRMHAAAICDTLMLLLAVIGVLVAYGFCAASLKVLLVLLFVWMTSPVTSHLMLRLVVTTDKDLEKECEVRK